MEYNNLIWYCRWGWDAGSIWKAFWWRTCIIWACLHC